MNQSRKLKLKVFLSVFRNLLIFIILFIVKMLNCESKFSLFLIGDQFRDQFHFGSKLEHIKYKISSFFRPFNML